MWIPDAWKLIKRAKERAVEVDEETARLLEQMAECISRLNRKRQVSKAIKKGIRQKRDRVKDALAKPDKFGTIRKPPMQKLYGFHLLSPGDAIRVQKEYGESLRSAAYHYKKNHPDFKFITRTTATHTILWRVYSEEGAD